MSSKSAGSRDAWLRRDKWLSFYEGTHAPHLPPDTAGTLALLPWRVVGKPASQLVEFIGSGAIAPSARAVELGCGTGENLVCLARATREAVGIDIVPAAVEATRQALSAADVTNARAEVADLLRLADDSSSAALEGGFDFAFDCQTYHCLRQVDVDAAGAAVASLLRPGGTLLLLTGNADEPDERGPVRLTRDELVAGLTPAGLTLLSCEPFHFDETANYERQAAERGYARPPLGWRSVWRRA